MSDDFRDELVELGDALSREATLAYDASELEASAAAAAPASDWYKRPYAKADPIGPAELPRPLYFPNNKAGKPASPGGPDVVAYKRTVSRLGRWPWKTFDDLYGQAFGLGASANVIDSGVAGVQRAEGIDDTGYLGAGVYDVLRRAIVPPGLPHAGEYGMDATAIRLLQDAAQRFAEPVATIEDVRAELEAYCRESLANSPAIHYEQFRPMTHLGVPPAQGFTADCSGHATSAYYWARKATGVAVPDPNHRGYDGYGYTGTLVENPEASPPFKVGDLALYGPSRSSTSHVTTCYRAGGAADSLWCSHGSEDAPYTVDLHYRSDLLVVVRPALMP